MIADKKLALQQTRIYMSKPLILVTNDDGVTAAETAKQFDPTKSSMDEATLHEEC